MTSSACTRSVDVRGAARGGGKGLVPVLLCGLAISSLFSSPAGSFAAEGKRRSIDWPTYGFDSQRTGFNPQERALGVRSVRRLRRLWAADLGAVVNTQPILAARVKLPSGRRRDVLYAGSEHGDFFAIDAVRGRILWRRNLGTGSENCPETTPDNVFGISGAPTLDRRRNRVYVAGGDGRAYAFDMSSGRLKRGWPIAVTRDPAHERVWGGLIAWRGLLYVPVASYCQIQPYYGKVVAIRTGSARHAATWVVTGETGVVGGGVWGWGGVSVDPRDSDVYAATGNSFSPAENDGLAERVVRLSPLLRVKASHHPTLREPKQDRDFGTTPVLYRAGGCPPQLVVENKSGALFVYDRRRISRGPVQRLQLATPSSDGQRGLVGVPAYARGTRSIYVTSPTDSPRGRYRRGLLAFRVTRRCRLALTWQRSLGRNALLSSPSVANGVVYVGDGIGERLFAYDARRGRRLWTSGRRIRAPIFAAPSVVNGRVYVAAWDRKIHAFGVPKRRR